MEDNPFIMPADESFQEPSVAIEYVAPAAVDEPAGVEVEMESAPMSDAAGPDAQTAGYRAVVDIGGNCATAQNWPSLVARLDILLAFVVLVFCALPKRVKPRVAGLSRLFDYPLALDFALVVLSVYAFRYPAFFGISPRGGIGLMGTLLFVVVIGLSSWTAALSCVAFQRRHDIFLRAEQRKMDGIKYLEYGMSLFAFTSVLFLFATESELALGLSFAVMFAWGWLFFARRPPRSLDRLMSCRLVAIGAVVAVFSALCGSALALAIGAVLTAKGLKNVDVP